MKNTLFIVIFLLLAMAAIIPLQAQKFGHLNSGNILVQLPETKTADDKLKNLQDSLVAVGEAKAKVLQEEYVEFAKKYQAGNVPPAQAQKWEEEFQKKQEELKKFETEIANVIANQREQLLGPILERLQKAITDVGKEGSYSMIFDTSVFNTILFARESDDLEPMVLAKLGIKK